MTDQEKAATFIGWHEGLKCSGCMDPDGHGFTGQIIDGEPEMFSHDLPCPDMADARNYMKALEIAGRKFEWFQIQYQGGDSYWVTIGGYLDYDGSPYDYKSMADGKSTAEAVIATLAVLYNAEHATQAGAEP